MSKVADRDLGEVVVLDVDATIMVAHSGIEQAAPTFKDTCGFHSIGMWCDDTTELLAARSAGQYLSQRHCRSPRPVVCGAHQAANFGQNRR